MAENLPIRRTHAKTASTQRLKECILARLSLLWDQSTEGGLRGERRNIIKVGRYHQTMNQNTPS
jgi:hypothetical protein